MDALDTFFFFFFSFDVTIARLLCPAATPLVHLTFDPKHLSAVSILLVPNVLVEIPRECRLPQCLQSSVFFFVFFSVASNEFSSPAFIFFWNSSQVPQRRARCELSAA